MTTLAESQIESTTLSTISNDELGLRITDLVGAASRSLSELESLVREAWRRLEDGQTVNGCRTKTEFCDKILHKSHRAVQYMLVGGNHNRTDVTRDAKRVSPSDPKTEDEFHPEFPVDAPQSESDDAPLENPPDPVALARRAQPQPRTPNPNFNREGTRGFKDKPHLNTFLGRLMAIRAVGITSPFSKTAGYALKECDSQAAKAVIVNLDFAIGRLKEYRKQFEAVSQ